MIARVPTSRWRTRLKSAVSILDADDREIIYRFCWRAAVCVVGVIGASATAGLAWTVFRLTGGL